MGQLANPSPAFQRSALPERSAKESEFGCTRRYPFIARLSYADPSKVDDPTAILLSSALAAAQGKPQGVTVQSLLAAISDNILANMEHGDSGIALSCGALENLRLAIGVLNKRDERLRQAVAANAAVERVPALITA